MLRIHQKEKKDGRKPSCTSHVSLAVAAAFDTEAKSQPQQDSPTSRTLQASALSLGAYERRRRGEVSYAQKRKREREKAFIGQRDGCTTHEGGITLLSPIKIVFY